MTEDEKEAHDYEMFISPTIWPSQHEFEIGLEAWKERGRRDKVKIERLEEIIRAQSKIMECYRLGKVKVPEWALDVFHKGKEDGLI